jgi:hypothetical protein
MEIFATNYQNEFRAEFDKRGLTYEHRLIDDMVAPALKWNGDYAWACKNYDGDAVRHRGAELWYAASDDVGAAEPGCDESGGRGGARHRHTAFLAKLDHNLRKPMK